MKAVLFDLDETLLDRNLSLRHFCRWQATEQLGLNRVDDYVSRFIALDANGSVWKDRVYWMLKCEFGLQWSVDELVSQYLNHFCEFCQLKEQVCGYVDGIYSGTLRRLVFGGGCGVYRL